MKTNKIKLYAGMLTTACIALTACSEDDNVAAADGSPIAFTASIKAPVTRIIDNQWETNDKVAIAIDGSTEYRIYTVGANNQMTSDNAYDWDGTEHTVKAWSPILTEAKDISNQSDNGKFSACDFLASEATIKSKDVKLQFSHVMTRAWYELQVAEGYSEDEINKAVIEFYGYPKANFTNGTLTGEGTITTITTRKMLDDWGVMRRGEAFLVPAEMWNQPLIKVTIGGNTYTYTPSNKDPESDDVKKKRGVLETGKWQRYYLKIKESGLEVTMTSSVSWGNKEDISSDAIENGMFHAAVNADITGKADYSATNIENGNITGETFTVTYTENGTGGIAREGKCDMTRTTNGTSHTYTFSNIRSDISLSYVDEYVAVGDYFYSDGTWGSAEHKDGVQTVGIVFKIGAGKGDIPANYGFTKIRGYVAAISNLTQDSYKWINNSDGNNNESAQLLKMLGEEPDYTLDKERNNQELYNGYALTQSILSHIKTSMDEYPVFAQLAGEQWKAITSGNQTYSWYLPSVAQFKDIAGSGKVVLTNNYWTSTNSADKDGEGNVTRIWAFNFKSADNNSGNCWGSDAFKLLPILTF